MIGETVTHYRILDKIGEGGMGVVYRAEDTRLGRQVAVKFLSAKLSQDPAALDRFQREARAASALNHPHICALYDVGRHGDLPFLVMELLDGGTLRKRVAEGPLPQERVLDYAVQITDALDYAHSLGIVHRDIKTANIFMNERGRIKVLDFGLAKLIQPRGGVDPYSDTTMAAPGEQGPTVTGQAMGTLSCMSPEQARGDDVDSRTDLFSLGIVLYEMATGHEAFAGKTPALMYDAILHQTPARPSVLNPKISPELDQIIAKALEKDRTLRYQSAAELRADLRRLQRDTDPSRLAQDQPTRPRTLSAPVEPPASLGGATPASKRRRFVAAAGMFLVVLAGAALTYWLTRTPTAVGIDSIAVLPFATSGAPADSDYLTDGITETLINGLSQLPGLRVAARSVVFRYKGRDIDPQQVGRDLNVRAVVTGRVSLRGDRLIIQADLMSVADGTQLWGNQYNRGSADLLEVQEDIAGEILDKLRPRLSGEEKKLATRRYTDDAVAYQLYLQGRYHWNKGTIAGYKKAIEYFQQAIAKDPKYALAHAGLADSYLLLGTYWVEALTEAKAAAEQALRLDPTLSEAHVALGHIKLWLDWDWPAAERQFKEGISLSSSSALAHNQYAMYLATLGRTAEAIVEARRALDLDPLSPIVNSDLGWHLLYSGQHQAAIEQFRKTLEFDNTSVSAHQGLGIAFSEVGQHDEAIAELSRALQLSENSPAVMGHLGAAHARRRNRAAAEGVLKDLQTLATREYVPSSAVAVIYAALNDKAHALDWLEKALDEHDFSMAQVNVAPWFKSLRGEDRFQRLLTKLGIPR